MVVVNIDDKSTNGTLSASEFNEILDALKDGTKTVNASDYQVSGVALATSNLVNDSGFITSVTPASISAVPDGKIKLFSDDTTTIYTTITSAVAAASTGDLITVGPGTYDENNLLKDGVNYYFEPGAIVDYTGTVNGAIFADGGESFTVNIAGEGVFIHRGNCVADKQVFNFTGASEGIIKGKSLYSATSVGIRIYGTTDLIAYFDEVKAYDGVLDNLSTTGGKLVLYCDRLIGEDSFCVETDNSGILEVHARIIECSAPYTVVITVASGGSIKIYGARIYDNTGNGIYEGTSVNNVALELHDCILYSDADPVFVCDAAVLHNTFMSDGRIIAADAGDVTFFNKLNPNIFSGSSAPSITPQKVGDLFVNTSAGNVYVSKGTSSSADWVQVNN